MSSDNVQLIPVNKTGLRQIVKEQGEKNQRTQEENTSNEIKLEQHNEQRRGTLANSTKHNSTVIGLRTERLKQ